MFPDSDIVKGFKLSRTKAQHTVNHGVPPYFKTLLKTNIDKSTIIVVSFDESQNQIPQNRRK